MAIISTFCLVFIISGSVAILILQDVKVGMIESVAFIVLITQSYNHVLLLSITYLRTMSTLSRQGKVEQTYAEVGPVILASSLNQILVSAFLLIGKTTIFYTFGKMVVLIQTFSFVSCFFLFSANCLLYGPIKQDGQITCRKAKTNRVATEPLPLV